jgi:hypothetical protein
LTRQAKRITVLRHNCCIVDLAEPEAGLLLVQEGIVYSPGRHGITAIAPPATPLIDLP